MISYPLYFEAQAEAAQNPMEPWKFQCGSQNGLACVPREFEGGGGGLSPEDLYAQALTNCFLATLQVYTRASKVKFGHVSAKSTLTVDRNENGQPWMKHLKLRVELEGVERPDRMITLVDKSIRSGFVLNSVKTAIEHELYINGQKA